MASDPETVAVGIPATVTDVPLTSVPGNRYVMVSLLGRGGMGEVWRAYDAKLGREVALKFLRSPDPSLRTTLVDEARAMAKISDPNVVEVFDTTSAGIAVVLVMEYLSGQTLGTWLVAEPRSWRSVLRMFIGAGRGLQAAHCAGLVHLDFKPANVLMTAEEIPKVTDFGLARQGAVVAVGIPVSTGTAVAPPDATSLSSVRGTPRFMAPEQHLGGGLTAAADQYAFCVALWDALCGAPPFSRSGQGASPTDKIPWQGLYEAKVASAPSWPAEVRVPRPVVRAIARGLCPDPADRWSNMNSLLSALQRWVRPRRWHWPLAVIATGATIVAVEVASASPPTPRCTGAARAFDTVWSADVRSAVHEAFLATGVSFAPTSADTTTKKLDDYAARWKKMHQRTCEAASVEEVQSASTMDLRMNCLRRARVDFAAAVDVLGTVDAESVSHAAEVVGTLRPLARCANVDALEARVEPPIEGEEGTVEAIRALVASARANEHAGHYVLARNKIDEARPLGDAIRHLPTRAELELASSESSWKMGDFEEAARHLLAAYDLASQARANDLMATAASDLMYLYATRLRRSAETQAYMRLARGLAASDEQEALVLRGHIGAVYVIQGKFDAAAAVFEEVLGRVQRGAHNAVNVATVHHNYGIALRDGGKFLEAEAQYEAALELRRANLGSGHPLTAKTLTSLANCLQHLERFDEAEELLMDSIKRLEAAVGADSPDTATARMNLAGIYFAQGKVAAAENEMRRVVSAHERVYGATGMETVRARANLVATLVMQGKSGDALEEAQKVLDARLDALGADHPEVAQSRSTLGAIFQQQGRFAEAEDELREALRIWSGSLGGDHPHVLDTRTTLSSVLAGAGELRAAEKELNAVLPLFAARLGPNSPTVAVRKTDLVNILMQQGRKSEALQVARSAWDVLRGAQVPAAQRAKGALSLAQVLWETNRRGRAVALVRDVSAKQHSGDPDGALVDEKLRAWLDAHR